MDDKTHDKLEDAIVLLVCTASRDFVRVRDVPLHGMFKSKGLDNNLASSSIAYLRAEGFIQIEGEKGGMLWKIGKRVYPKDGSLVDDIIAFHERRKSEKADNLKLVVKEKKNKVKKNANDLEKTSKPIIMPTNPIDVPKLHMEKFNQDPEVIREIVSKAGDRLSRQFNKLLEKPTKEDFGTFDGMLGVVEKIEDKPLSLGDTVFIIHNNRAKEGRVFGLNLEFDGKTVRYTVRVSHSQYDSASGREYIKIDDLMREEIFLSLENLAKFIIKEVLPFNK